MRGSEQGDLWRLALPEKGGDTYDERSDNVFVGLSSARNVDLGHDQSDFRNCTYKKIAVPRCHELTTI